MGTAYSKTGLMKQQWTFFAGTFCFPSTNHVIILRRTGFLFCRLKRAHASMNMAACTLFNEQNKGPTLLSVIT